MKFSFSTIGCPSWSWGEILSAAHDLHYDGIEIRGLGKELYAPRVPIFQPEQWPETEKRLKSLGVAISCLTSACYLFDKKDQAAMLQMGRDYIDAASRIGAPNIRVMGDQGVEPGDDIDIDYVAENLKTLAVYAQGKQVRVLLETNGVFACTKTCADVLRQVDEPAAGILWDVHHPYRFMSEDAAESYANIKPWLCYLHMKDSQVIDGQLVYRMMGFGDVPNEKILGMLRDDGFSGYVALEWVKRWNKTMTEPDIVFPHFINYVHDFLR